MMAKGTRQALHGVAEMVLAGPQFRTSGSIELAVLDGGFGTVARPLLRVRGTELVVDERAVPMNGLTFREVATAADVTAGRPEGVYKEGSGLGPDDTIGIDAGEAAVIERAFAWGREALLRLEPNERPILWPEHFDIAITVDEVNYGVSPGDGYLPEPYAYAGPWRTRVGAFWNAPFGAARPLRLLPGATAVHDFFSEARDRVASDPPREP
ncbi:hypothetical protein [Actinomadura gamaensis]|uniref:Uncharacterized protein n=1 Tax=Actinomadura gamaensis TaxID=1763541 RepID=A0ABV9U351_9ACTN